jgi:hypothetical protein
VSDAGRRDYGRRRTSAWKKVRSVAICSPVRWAIAAHAPSPESLPLLKQFAMICVNMLSEALLDFTRGAAVITCLQV